MSWLEKAKVQIKEKTRSTQLVIYLGLIGMALILVCEIFGNEAKKSVDETDDSVLFTSQHESLTTLTISTEESYRKALEETLAGVISQLDGAGNAVVMITLTNGEETIYAQNTTLGETQSVQNHVLLEDGSALSETVKTPTIGGVVVLCEGGDNIAIEAKITAMVTALFDISSNHISVEKLA